MTEQPDPPAVIHNDPGDPGDLAGYLEPDPPIGCLSLTAGPTATQATDGQARDPELTAEEARALVDDLGLQLYYAQDALDLVAERCDLADQKGHQPTTAEVRQWLKGARCARQIAAEQRERTTANNPPTSNNTKEN